MASQAPNLPLSAATNIASYSPPPPGPEGIAIEISQAEHRIRLVNAWGAIVPGGRVLELGCGQGTCTTVLAEAVGPAGHVDAVDPGAPDYGAPYTLAQAQEFVSKSAVGPRIGWHRCTPEEFLAKTEDAWDVAVLAHCIWYFKSSAILESILRALKGRVKTVCIAEYGLKATEMAAVPHVLATLTRGMLECHKKESNENIQSPSSPRAIKEAAAEAGWKVTDEGELVPDASLSDGMWEAGTVVWDGFLDEIAAIKDERVVGLLRSAMDATKSATVAIGGVKKVQTMDVWHAVLSEGSG